MHKFKIFSGLMEFVNGKLRRKKNATAGVRPGKPIKKSK